VNHSRSTTSGPTEIIHVKATYEETVVETVRRGRLLIEGQGNPRIRPDVVLFAQALPFGEPHTNAPSALCRLETVCAANRFCQRRRRLDSLRYKWPNSSAQTGQSALHHPSMMVLMTALSAFTRRGAFRKVEVISSTSSPSSSRSVPS
jgi:hypothetical protein